LFTPEEFYELKPDLDDRQRELLSCYYSVRREGESGRPIKAKEIEEKAELINYETDFAVMVLQKIDDHYLKLCADELKRKSKA